MATPAIKLEPIKMGSLINGATSGATSGGTSAKYLPPNARPASEKVSIDLGVNNFPCLGVIPKKTGSWGKHVVITKPRDVVQEEPLEKVRVVNMSDKIKDQLRQEELLEEEKKKPREEDPLKMTREELLQDGWAILSMSQESLKGCMGRLNSKDAPAYEDYYE